MCAEVVLYIFSSEYYAWPSRWASMEQLDISRYVVHDVRKMAKQLGKENEKLDIQIICPLSIKMHKKGLDNPPSM